MWQHFEIIGCDCRLAEPIDSESGIGEIRQGNDLLIDDWATTAYSRGCGHLLLFISHTQLYDSTSQAQQQVKTL